jgi:hypothetical protein
LRNIFYVRLLEQSLPEYGHNWEGNPAALFMIQLVENHPVLRVLWQQWANKCWITSLGSSRRFCCYTCMRQSVTASRINVKICISKVLIAFVWMCFDWFQTVPCKIHLPNNTSTIKNNLSNATLFPLLGNICPRI